MANKKINVLVYSGNGTTASSVRHCIYTLRRILTPAYTVITINSEILLKEPWSSTCALLVVPGGADLGYCRTLNGEGNRRISRYVNAGGAYLGFCAGGYYGTARCEFEVDDPKMAVVGERELAFYPGACRGLAFAGFVYHSEVGARAADLKIEKSAFPEAKSDLPDSFKSYYNGGGVFVDAETLKKRGVEILARYLEDLHVDSGDGSRAAVVYRRVGEGHMILTGPHPEFAPSNLTKIPSLHSSSAVIDDIASTDNTRVVFMRLCLRKLGLIFSDEQQTIPSLSDIHLSAYRPAAVAHIVAAWSEIIIVVDDEEYVVGGNDIFHVRRESASRIWGLEGLKQAIGQVTKVLPTSLATTGESADASFAPDSEVPPEKHRTTKEDVRTRIAYTASSSQDPMLEYDQIVKTLVSHTETFPSEYDTPDFDHNSYYANFSHHHSKLSNASTHFGTPLLYGATVTSTNTLLEKNLALIRTLPTGTTLTATTQVAGRGRGGNVWLSPPGCLMFSTVIHHPFSLTQTAPVVFIQYLCALAVVEGVRNYGPGYERLSIKLKWPNDIYAYLPADDEDGIGRKNSRSSSTPPELRLVKICGILVNSSYSGTGTDAAYNVVAGIGVNLSNALPTTSLNRIAAALSPPLRPLTQEKLLASILAAFESLYVSFCRSGWHAELEEMYYAHWLHSDQIVTVETEGGMRARIKGITRDWGLLVAEELGWEDRGTGKEVALQSDGNSFDFFKGLIRRKI